jgi:hypothetical protein
VCRDDDGDDDCAAGDNHVALEAVAVDSGRGTINVSFAMGAEESRQ